MKFLILPAFFISIFATHAHAADLTLDTTSPWAGAYLGVQAGYTFGKSPSGGFFLLGPGADILGDLEPDGFTGGLYAGYNFQSGTPLVIGVEGDVEYGDIKGSSALYLDGILVPSNTMTSEMNWRGSIRARAGYAIDRFLPYVTAGIAFGKYELTPNYALTGPLPDSKVQVGPTVGVGVEYAISDRINARVEYRYTDFGDAKYAIPGFGGFFESRTELTTQDIKVGLSFKF